MSKLERIRQARAYARLPRLTRREANLYLDLADDVEDLTTRIGMAIVAVQNGEPEETIIGMLHGALTYDHNTVVRTEEQE